MNDVELTVDIDNPPEGVDELGEYADSILSRLAIDNWHMGLMLTDDEGIHDYNLKWRGKDSATDVLSFAQNDGDEVPMFPGAVLEAGDIIISIETVERNASKWKSPFEEELRRVVVHGILHLNGMDHPNDDYETGMLKLQEEIVADTPPLRSF